MYAIHEWIILKYLAILLLKFKGCGEIMSVLLREQEVKIALIDWLFKKGLLENATLINEMVVADWSRRADLAVANGHLQAFEIKSDFDSLKRLDGQLETFVSRFEKVTVVCAPKFTYEVTKKVASDIGVIEYSNTNHGVRFKIVQRGRTSILRNKSIYLNFLLKKELQTFLVENGSQLPFETSRESLENMAYQFSLSRIRSFTLNALKNRYKETSSNFLKKLVDTSFSSETDLNLLSKAKLRREHNKLNASGSIKIDASNEFYTANIENFMRKHGEVGNTQPIKVLKRVIK